MKFNTFLESIVNIEHIDLLGEIAHAKMSPSYRLKMAEKMKQKQKEAQIAAVLALFYPNVNNDTTLVLILRNTYKGVHSAQVGFPGGKVEASDINLKATALRETEEEIGVKQHSIEIVKEMSPLYIPPSNFLVHPFMGISKKPLQFIKDDGEVNAIIEVSLQDLLDETKVQQTKVPTSYNVEVEVPAFILNDYVVWGATAMMLSEIKVLLKALL
ncbi:NUDIX hydrolase [Winogradskyella immobilis]|uniref:CoA pyrophosphatase n=1 Tax=Winogradskyella immobilis TaxID=2816852 RepID=A0ABS8ERD4_9FLAO|nr:CoA pyrophosphatase [Winogradskyella immobilis]MCC1484857.1 CoA pyrophosphatase [Winogradskyella immobilis]MCG0016949.1 CoA pyrophosphatase [Winogradskyella immobilis]